MRRASGSAAIRRVGLGVAGEREVVGRDGEAHGRHRMRPATPPPARYDPMRNRPVRRRDAGRSPSGSGSLLDVESGEPAATATLLVARRPVEASPVPTTACPTDARVLDLGGLTVLPGLIDTHSHLVGEVQTARRAGSTTSGARRTRCSACATPGSRSRRASRPSATSARSAPSSTARCATRSTAATSRGRGCSAPARSSPRPGAAATSSASRTTSGSRTDLRFGVVTSPAEVRERVRRLLIGGADLIKCIGTGRRPDPRRRARRARAVRGRAPGRGRGSRPLRTRSSRSTRTRAEGAQRAIRAGARSVEHGSMLDDETIAMLADTGTFFSVDLYDGEWALEHGDGRAAGPPRRCASSPRRWTRAIEAFGEARRRAASGSPTGPTAASTRTRSSRSSSTRSCGTGWRRSRPSGRATVVAAECLGLGGPRRAAWRRAGSRTSWRSMATRWPTSRVLERPVGRRSRAAGSSSTAAPS